MECVQKKYEPTEVLHKGSDNNTLVERDFHSPDSYEHDDEEMIDIMDVWKANYAIQESQLPHHHHMQFHVEYPSTSSSSSSSSQHYYEDDNCNNVEYTDSGTTHHHSVTEVIRTAVAKAGVQLQEDKRRVSRQFLTNLNIAQLQVIVNDLQRYIELLNDELVQLLMERDELQMSQDATLIDIEDLSLYFSEEMMQNKYPRN